MTLAQLRAIMPHLPETRAAELLPHLEQAMAEFGISTPPRQAAFLAQLAHESGELRWWEEQPHRTSIPGCRACALALPGGHPAGAQYEGRKDLGNLHPGDGVRFKGRGPIQLTGRAGYRGASRALFRGGMGGGFASMPGIETELEAHPERVADRDVGFRVAGWFWATRGLNELADQAARVEFHDPAHAFPARHPFDAITERINGGQNGRANRWTYYRRALQVLGLTGGKCMDEEKRETRHVLTDGGIGALAARHGIDLVVPRGVAPDDTDDASKDGRIHLLLADADTGLPALPEGLPREAVALAGPQAATTTGRELQVGDTVLYILSRDDVTAINRRRTSPESIRMRLEPGAWPRGAQAHIGNPVVAGEILPLVVTKVWSGEHGPGIPGVNGQVVLDGNDQLWVTSVRERSDAGSAEQGTWFRRLAVLLALITAGLCLAPTRAWAGDAGPSAPGWWWKVLELVLPVIALPLLGAVASGAVWLLARGFGWLRLRVHNARTLEAIALVETFAETAVRNVEATLRPQLVGALQDRHLTPAEVTQLRRAALDAVKSQGPTAVEVLRGELRLGAQALDEVLLGLIERTHAQLPPTMNGMLRAAGASQGYALVRRNDVGHARLGFLLVLAAAALLLAAPVRAQQRAVFQGAPVRQTSSLFPGLSTAAGEHPLTWGVLAVYDIGGQRLGQGVFLSANVINLGPVGLGAGALLGASQSLRGLPPSTLTGLGLTVRLFDAGGYVGGLAGLVTTDPLCAAGTSCVGWAVGLWGAPATSFPQ